MNTGNLLRHPQVLSRDHRSEPLESRFKQVMEGHALCSLHFLRADRSVRRVRGGRAANCILACYLLAMGSLVECGTLCSVVFSRMGRPQLAVQDSRYLDGAVWRHFRHPDRIHLLVPITDYPTPQTTPMKRTSVGISFATAKTNKLASLRLRYAEYTQPISSLTSSWEVSISAG
jgi:hypothetical protein